MHGNNCDPEIKFSLLIIMACDSMNLHCRPFAYDAGAARLMWAMNHPFNDSKLNCCGMLVRGRWFVVNQPSICFTTPVSINISNVCE